jgi:hypothetical protein
MDLNIFHLQFERILGEIQKERTTLLAGTALPEPETFEYLRLVKKLQGWERQLELLNRQMTRTTSSARMALQLEKASAQSFARIDRYRALQSIESRRDNLQKLERKSEQVRNWLNALIDRFNHPTRAETAERAVKQLDEYAEKVEVMSATKTAIGDISNRMPVIRSLETPHADATLLLVLTMRAISVALLAAQKQWKKPKG